MRQLTATAELKDHYDIVVVGAGPAGLAGGTTAASHHASVVVLDEGASPGGQFYRSVGRSGLVDPAIFDSDYWSGKTLVDAFSDSALDYLPRATVWSVDKDRLVAVSAGGVSRIISAKHVIAATGALERPFPVRGWTRPGVMTAGAAQILLKSSGLVPGGKVVLAGTGPLLLQLAVQLRRAGHPPHLLLDTRGARNVGAALKHIPSFLSSPYFSKSLRMLREARPIPAIRRVTDISIEPGTTSAHAVHYVTARGKSVVEADHVILHQGIAPNVNLGAAIGCRHVWNDAQLSWQPVCDEWGATDVDGVAIAGDARAIVGAEASEASGRLAALDALLRLGMISLAARNREGETVRRRQRKYAKARPFVDALFSPPVGMRVPSGDTVVCRCEEVTAAQIETTVRDLQVSGPAQLKAFLRCGMGPCQGRLCGLTVCEMIARERNVSPQEVGYFRIRNPVKPVRVSEIAGMPHTDADIGAVVGRR